MSVRVCVLFTWRSAWVCAARGKHGVCAWNWLIRSKGRVSLCACMGNPVVWCRYEAGWCLSPWAGLWCQADCGAKKTKHEQVVAGQFLLMAGVKVALRICADSLADDDRKLEWTLDALEFEDPFDKEVVVHSDILKCLRCLCFLSFWCAG